MFTETAFSVHENFVIVLAGLEKRRNTSLKNYLKINRSKNLFYNFFKVCTSWIEI